MDRPLLSVWSSLRGREVRTWQDSSHSEGLPSPGQRWKGFANSTGILVDELWQLVAGYPRQLSAPTWGIVTAVLLNPAHLGPFFIPDSYPSIRRVRPHEVDPECHIGDSQRHKQFTRYVIYCLSAFYGIPAEKAERVYIVPLVIFWINQYLNSSGYIKRSSEILFSRCSMPVTSLPIIFFLRGKCWASHFDLFCVPGMNAWQF